MVPEELYPVRVKISWFGPSTPQDWKLWKKLHELGFNQDEIAVIKGWSHATIRKGLHKMGIYGGKARNLLRCTASSSLSSNVLQQ